MKKQKKLLFAMQIVCFLCLCAINLYLMIQKFNADMVLLDIIAVFFFLLWFFGKFFSEKIVKAMYKLFEKPTQKSIPMDFWGIKTVCEQEAYRKFSKISRGFYYASCIFLLIGTILLLID